MCVVVGSRKPPNVFFGVSLSNMNLNLLLDEILYLISLKWPTLFIQLLVCKQMYNAYNEHCSVLSYN